MQVDRLPGKCLDILLSRVDGSDSSYLYLKMKIHGYEDKTRTFRFWIQNSAETMACVIQHSLSGMDFGDEPVREVFFHNNRSAPETPVPDKLYTDIFSYLKYPISIQSRMPVVRRI